MVPDALIVGGSGVIGRAIALRMAAAGWQVRVTGRIRLPVELRTAGVSFISGDRADMQRESAAGVDLLVDCACYTADHARALVELAAEAGSTVLLSSKAVYIDPAGNHANSDVEPRFDGPLPESAPTVAPGHIDYNSRVGYAANKVAAEQVSLDSGRPITVLRPSRVHGVGNRRPREWVFVKRILDGRRSVLLRRVLGRAVIRVEALRAGGPPKRLLIGSHPHGRSNGE
ncbi:NAD-dependent epimerase/dehydratase family protein [Nocardia sp. CA-120079]|uniref:NAD-dependent epimerase/dehydratase family protein n=1 Tax=Nocardia sp. CA-120079 TaxID=3239974 RepID=UPI003D95396A